MPTQSASISVQDINEILSEHIAQLSLSLGADYDPRPIFSSFSEVVDSRWNQERAVALIRAARLAYQPNRVVESILSKENNIAVSWLNGASSGTQGFVVLSPKFSVMAFRGTETTGLTGVLKDIRTDVNLRQHTYCVSEVRKGRAVQGQCGDDEERVGRIHKGFWKGLDDVWSKLISDLDINNRKNIPIWITGHSLGGALATIAAARLAIEENAEIGGLYTFGQPRVGDDDFATKAREIIGKHKIFRIYRSVDPVPMVPWHYSSIVSKLSQRTIERWQHVSGSQRCFVSRHGSLDLDASPNRLERWTDKSIVLLNWAFTFWSAKRLDLSYIASHHEAKNYLQAIMHNRVLS